MRIMTTLVSYRNGVQNGRGMSIETMVTELVKYDCLATCVQRVKSPNDLEGYTSLRVKRPNDLEGYTSSS